MKLKILYAILIISIILNVGLVNNYIEYTKKTAVDETKISNDFERLKVLLLGVEYYMEEVVKQDNPIEFYRNLWIGTDRVMMAQSDLRLLSLDISKKYSIEMRYLDSLLFDIYHDLISIEGYVITDQFKVITDENRTRIEGILREVKQLNEVLKEKTLNKEDLAELNNYLLNK